MEIVNRRDSAPFVTKDGSEIRSILDRTNSSAVNQSLAEATLPPGARTQPHVHPHTEEIYYILRGAGRMTVGAEEREVGPGDGILIPPGARHTIQNIGPSRWCSSAAVPPRTRTRTRCWRRERRA